MPQVDYYPGHGRYDAPPARRGCGGATSLDAGRRLLVLAWSASRARQPSIGAKLRSFLAWRGLECQVFNAGPASSASDDSLEKNLRPPQPRGFFDNANKDAAARRESIAMDTLDSLFDYLRAARARDLHATNPQGSYRKRVLDRGKGASRARAGLRRRLHRDDLHRSLCFIVICWSVARVVNE